MIKTVQRIRIAAIVMSVIYVGANVTSRTMQIMAFGHQSGHFSSFPNETMLYVSTISSLIYSMAASVVTGLAVILFALFVNPHKVAALINRRGDEKEHDDENEVDLGDKLDPDDNA